MLNPPLSFFTRRRSRNPLPAIVLAVLALSAAGCADAADSASIDIAAEFGSDWGSSTACDSVSWARPSTSE